jgi:hypothetical protein
MSRRVLRALGCGVAGAALSCVGLFTAPHEFFRALLVCFNYVAALAIGGLILLMLHNLTGGRWGRLVERPLRAAADTLPLVLVLLVPVLLDLDQLYPWAREQVIEASPILQKKLPYLEEWFFLVRQGIYAVVLLGLAWGLGRRPGPVSAGGLVALGLLIVFASLDWMMALEPLWYSTIYSLMVGATYLLGGMALAIVAVTAAAGPELSRKDTRDLGNLLLAFVLLWVYCAYSQYLLMWTGNLPEEILWYVRRTETSWRWLALALIVLHVALPFLILLTRKSKQSRLVIMSVAGLILVMRLVDFHWLVDPSLHPDGLHLSWLDLTVAIAVGGLWLALFLHRLERRATPAPEASRG